MQVSRHDSLREVLTVSSRGQITLPAEMRRHLGVEPGGAVIVEAFGGELRLKPAAVMEVELLSDEAIAGWEQADALSDKDRQQILKSLQAPLHTTPRARPRWSKLEGLFQLATSAYAKEEARRNLERKAPGCLPEFLHS